MLSKSSYNLSADVLRVLAILGVVSIHITYAIYARPDFFGGTLWWLALIINSFSRASIPLFIMVSGYFLLSKDESFKNSLKRTFHRILIPLIFWFGIQLMWNNSNVTLATVNWTIIPRLLTVNVFDLYFLIILLGLYVVAPILRAFLKSATYQTQKIFTFATLAFGVLAFFSQYMLFLCSRPDSLTYWLPYVGLFVGGYFLGNNLSKFSKKVPLVIAYGVGLGATIGMGALYYFLHWRGNDLLNPHGCISYYSDWYLSLNVIIMSLAAFILVMGSNFSWIPAAGQRLIFSIARASFGIYMLHTFFIDIFTIRYRIFDHIGPGWMHVILKWFAVFVFSYAATILLTKIPLVKRVFGETK